MVFPKYDNWVEITSIVVLLPHPSIPLNVTLYTISGRLLGEDYILYRGNRGFLCQPQVLHHRIDVKRPQVLVVLPGADVQDWLLRDIGDRDRGPAFLVHVRLGQDDAVDGYRVVEGLGLLHAVVAGDALPDENLEVGLRHAHDLLHLVDQVGIAVHPSGSIYQHHVNALCLAVLDGVERHRCRVCPVVMLHPPDAQLVPVLRNLLDGGRPEGVGCGQHHAEAFFPEVRGELRDGRRLAAAVDAHECDDVRLLPLLPYPRHDVKGAFEEPPDGILQRDNDRFLHPAAPDGMVDKRLFQVVLDLVDDLYSHVILQQRHLHLGEHVLELLPGDFGGHDFLPERGEEPFFH